MIDPTGPDPNGRCRHGLPAWVEHGGRLSDGRVWSCGPWGAYEVKPSPFLRPETRRVPTPARARRRAHWLRFLGIVSLVLWGLLTDVGFPLAGIVGGVALIALAEAYHRYGWADGYNAAQDERERVDG